MDTQEVGVWQRREKLAGKLSFVAGVLPSARPFASNIFQLAGRMHKARHRHTLSAGVKSDIAAWLKYIRAWNGKKSWVRAAPQLELCSDASVSGWGAWVVTASPGVREAFRGVGLDVGACWAGTWSAEDRALINSHRQIAWGELFAAAFALQQVARAVGNVTVKFWIDNSGDVFSINRQRVKAQYPELRLLMQDFFLEATLANIRPVAQHLSGEDNDLSDYLSRPEKQPEGLDLGVLRAAFPQFHLTSLVCVDSGAFARARLWRSSRA